MIITSKTGDVSLLPQKFFVQINVSIQAKDVFHLV
jgi:hypothetical protein